MTAASLSSQTFDAATMRPRVRAAIRFVESTGKRAAIGSLDEVVTVVRGTALLDSIPLTTTQLPAKQSIFPRPVRHWR